MTALTVIAAVCGLGLVVVGLVRHRRPAVDIAGYLADLDDEGPRDVFERQLRMPFASRVLRPLGARAVDGIHRLAPADYLERVHKRLLLAGVRSWLRPEDFVVGQTVALLGGLVLALAYSGLSGPSPRNAVLVTLLLPAAGWIAPRAWLNRKVEERQESIRRDLPDVLDLLAISVEAGSGFEAAVQVVTTNFTSPLAAEFSHTLKEMELGLPRREALSNLKRRTEVSELSTFVLALTQADALGMPIGRVLHTQAAEMRKKRRQRAREKAAKLPVKILFPLVLFIFPAVLVVLLGPAASSIMGAFG